MFPASRFPGKQRKWYPRRKVKRLLSRLALAGISLLATFVVLEMGLRLFHPVDFMSPTQKISAKDERGLLMIASPVPGALYELRADAEKTVAGVDVKTNHFGMRNHSMARRGIRRTKILSRC